MTPYAVKPLGWELLHQFNDPSKSIKAHDCFTPHYRTLSEFGFL